MFDSRSEWSMCINELWTELWHDMTDYDFDQYTTKTIKLNQMYLEFIYLG